MKYLIIFLMLLTFNCFGQSGYYFFESDGQTMKSKSEWSGVNPEYVYRDIISYTFYSSSKPLCSELFTFLEVNHPNFSYGSGSGGACRIKGPYATKGEAQKQRDISIATSKKYDQKITHIIFEGYTTKNKSSNSSTATKRVYNELDLYRAQQAEEERKKKEWQEKEKRRVELIRQNAKIEREFREKSFNENEKPVRLAIELHDFDDAFSLLKGGNEVSTYFLIDKLHDSKMDHEKIFEILKFKIEKSGVTFKLGPLLRNYLCQYDYSKSQCSQTLEVNPNYCKRIIELYRTAGYDFTITGTKSNQISGKKSLLISYNEKFYGASKGDWRFNDLQYLIIFTNPEIDIIADETINRLKPYKHLSESDYLEILELILTYGGNPNQTVRRIQKSPGYKKYVTNYPSALEYSKDRSIEGSTYSAYYESVYKLLKKYK